MTAKKIVNKIRDKKSNFNRPRPPQKCVRVSELVYKFLENVASANDEKRQRNNARNNFQRTHIRKYNRQNRRPDNNHNKNEEILKKSYLQSDSYDSSSLEKKLILKNSDVLKTFKRKSSSQFVKDYIKGVNESKQKAKKYMCKALSFGLETGLLIPNTNSDAQVLRISSSLNMRMNWRKESDGVENKEICFPRGSGLKKKQTRSESKISKNKRKK